MTFDMHHWFQDIMKEKADVLSGYQIVRGEPEARTHIQVDYFCTVRKDKPYQGPEQGIRPLADFQSFNVVELEGPGRTLNEGRLRYHLGRSLIVENPNGKKHRRGQTGLTILVVRKPVKLLGGDCYNFKKVTSWKYQTHFMKELPITIIILRELRSIKGGDSLAWLQLLEPNARRRSKTRGTILDQELTSRNRIKGIMMEMDKEAFMTIADEFREEGRKKGREEGREKGLEKGIQVLQGLLDDGLITPEVFQQRAALLVQDKDRKSA